MDNSTSIVLSRLVAQTRAMDVSATNLANASTPGFRKERMLFSDYLVRQPGGTSDLRLPPGGGRVLTYTQDRATYRDRAAGAINHTSNPLDLAISGDGFFTINTPTGPRLSRAGHFERAVDGTIVDEQGQALLNSTGKPLQLAPADTVVTVTADGTIASENGTIGKIGVVSPSDQNKLRTEGNRLLASDSPTQQVAAPQILQGAIEESNVQPAQEITKMMTDMREFQFAAQFIQAEADRQQSAIDKITAQRS